MVVSTDNYILVFLVINFTFYFSKNTLYVFNRLIENRFNKYVPHAVLH